MNKVEIIGRITKDPDVKTAQSGISYCFFSVAVDRRFKDANGNKATDFFECKAYKKTAEFMGSYIRKGDRIAVTGELRTDSYTGQDGKNKTKVYIQVDEIEGLEKKPQSQVPDVALPATPAPAPAPAPSVADQIQPSEKVQASMDFFQAQAEATLPFEV